MALAHATKEVIWLRKLLSSLGFYADEPTTLLGDNQGSLQLVKNQAHHSRTKHIDIRHHFIREKLGNEINVQYCPTDEMVADVLTKPLSKDKHNYCVKSLGVQIN